MAEDEWSRYLLSNNRLDRAWRRIVPGDAGDPRLASEFGARA